MEPKGLKSSCRSVSRVSSDRLVTRMVALSSAGHRAGRSSCQWPGQLGPHPQDNHWVLGGACPRASIRVPSLPHLCGWAAWTPHGGWPRPAGSVARTSLSCSGPPAQAPALETTSSRVRPHPSTAEGQTHPGCRHFQPCPSPGAVCQSPRHRLVPQRPGGHDDIKASSRKPAAHRARSHRC